MSIFQIELKTCVPLSSNREVGEGGRGGERWRDGGFFFWVSLVKSRNEIYCRLAQTERKLPLLRAFCAREDADSSSLVPPVFAKCQLTPDTVLYVCVRCMCALSLCPFSRLDCFVARR